MKIELTTVKELYQRFDETVWLAQIICQQGEDNGSIQFRMLYRAYGWVKWLMRTASSCSKGWRIICL